MMAIRKRWTSWHYCVGTVTAIGGTLREILLGRFPPFVFQQDQYLYTAQCLTGLSFCPADRINSIVLLADALGLGTFVTIGISQAEVLLLPVPSFWEPLQRWLGGIMRDLPPRKYLMSSPDFTLLHLQGVIFILVETRLARRLTMSIVTAVVVLPGCSNSL